MILDADWFNTYPNNGVEDGAVGENAVNASMIIGPIDLSSSETNALVLQFYSYYRICCFAAGNGANDLNVYISTDEGLTWNDLNYIEGDIYEPNVGKQTLSQIPLGGFSPNVESVHFKFEWIGTHYFWMIDDSDEIVSLNGDQRRTTNLNIKRVIGTYDDFVLTALSLQNNSTVFIDKTQKERKDLLAQFMGMGIFDLLYTRASEEINEVSAVLRNFNRTDYDVELADLEKQNKLEINNVLENV